MYTGVSLAARDPKTDTEDEGQNNILNDNNNTLQSQSQSTQSIPTGLTKAPLQKKVAVFQEEVIPDCRDPEFLLNIDRDYSGDNAPKCDSMGIRFCTKFPIELTRVVTQDQFLHTVKGVNKIFAEHERLNWSAILESIMFYLTCTMIGCCKKSRMQKAIDEVATFLYEENDQVYHPVGLHVVHPFARGLRKMVIRNIQTYGLYGQTGSVSQVSLASETE